MSAFNIFPSLTVRRLPAFAAFAFALVAFDTVAADTSFVVGKIEVTEITGTDMCKYMILEDLYATKDHISGTWRMSAPQQLSTGKFDVFMKKGKLVADFWGDGVERSIETTKRVGQDIRVDVELDYISGTWGSEIGFCEAAVVLPGIIAKKSDAEKIAKQLAEEKSRLARLREEQRIESERLAELKAGAERRLA